MSIAERAKQLSEQLNNCLAQKAQLDEQINGLRNMINGINLGTELQKEIDAEAQKAETVTED